MALVAVVVVGWVFLVALPPKQGWPCFRGGSPDDASTWSRAEIVTVKSFEGNLMRRRALCEGNPVVGRWVIH